MLDHMFILDVFHLEELTSGGRCPLMSGVKNGRESGRVYRDCRTFNHGGLYSVQGKVRVFVRGTERGLHDLRCLHYCSHITVEQVEHLRKFHCSDVASDFVTNIYGIVYVYSPYTH